MLTQSSSLFISFQWSFQHCDIFATYANSTQVYILMCSLMGQTRQGGGLKLHTLRPSHDDKCQTIPCHVITPQGTHYHLFTHKTVNQTGHTVVRHNTFLSRNESVCKSLFALAVSAITQPCCNLLIFLEDSKHQKVKYR